MSNRRWRLRSIPWRSRYSGALTPQFVVFTDDLWFLEESSKTVFRDLLGRHYVLATNIEGRNIYRRRPGPSA